MWPLSNQTSTSLSRSTVHNPWWSDNYPLPWDFSLRDFGGVMKLKLLKQKIPESDNSCITRWRVMTRVATTCHSELWFPVSWNAKSTWHMSLSYCATCHDLPPILFDMVCHIHFLLLGFRCFAFHDSGTPDDEESWLFQLPISETFLLPSGCHNPTSPCSLKNMQVLLDPTPIGPRAQI